MARATRFLFAVLLSTAPFVASRAVVRDGLLRRQQNENTTATTNSSMALSSTSSTSDSSTDSSTTEDWAAKYPASAKVAEQCGHVETCAFAARVGTADGCLKSVSAARSCGNDCSSGSPKGIYPAEDVLAALKEAYHACGALGQCIDIIESFPNDERPDVCKSGEQQDNDRRTVRGSGAPIKPDPGNSPFRRISMMQAGSLSCSSSCVSVNAILAKEDPCQREFRAAFYDCRDCGSSDGSTATSTLGTAEDLLNAYKSYCISQGWSLVSLGFTEMKTDGAESTSGSDGVENSSGNDSQTAVDGSAPAQADNSEQPEGETSERSAGTGGTSPSSDSSGNPSGSPSPPPSTTSISLSVFSSALVTSTASNGKLVTLTAPVALVTSTASNGDLFTLTSILPPVPSVSLADVTDVSGRIANTAVAAATPTQTSAAGKTLAVKGGAVLAAVLMAVIVL